MKSSILISSFAVLFLLIGFAESPSRKNSEKYPEITIEQVSYIPVRSINTVSKNKISRKGAGTVAKNTLVELNNDFSYLKFDVADYEADVMDAELIAVPEASENNYSALTFDVNDYSNEAPLISFETIEMPLNDFDYLKFDVNRFMESDNISSEAMELPVEDFGYLKFDVSDHSENSKITGITLGELPEAEITNNATENSYSYLKFDVSKYENAADGVTSDQMELPLH